jgi:peroxiredoxin
MDKKKILEVSIVGLAIFSVSLLFNSACAERGKQRSTNNSVPRAPDFSATTGTGQAFTLDSLTKRPLFLYFIKATCPVNARAVYFYELLASTYRDKVNLIGVIEGDKRVYESWQKRFMVSFPILLDPDLKIIRAYRAERSPFLIQVDPSKQIQNIWRGYSVSILDAINQKMAEAAKTSKIGLDFSQAPSRMTYG